MSPGRAALLAALAPAAAVEVYGITHPGRGFTYSELIRDGYRVHTPAGRAAFIASVVFLTAWITPHILRRLEESAITPQPQESQCPNCTR